MSRFRTEKCIQMDHLKKQMYCARADRHIQKNHLKKQMYCARADS